MMSPVGRTEAVNLVYDITRGAIVAIYGTVQDFRPFVEAFGRAYLAETREGTVGAQSSVDLMEATR